MRGGLLHQVVPPRPLSSRLQEGILSLSLVPSISPFRVPLPCSRAHLCLSPSLSLSLASIFLYIFLPAHCRAACPALLSLRARAYGGSFDLSFFPSARLPLPFSLASVYVWAHVRDAWMWIIYYFFQTPRSCMWISDVPGTLIYLASTLLALAGCVGGNARRAFRGNHFVPI